MRTIPLLACLTLVGAAGCGGKPDMRSDPVEMKANVKLAGGPAKDLTVSFNPMGDGLPIGGKVGADGTVTVKTVPGKYTFFFPPEPNNAVPAYKQIPAKYRSPNTEHAVQLSAGAPAEIEPK